MDAVVPFDILLDRRKRAKFLSTFGNNMETCMKPKVVLDAGLALASLVICEEALERELIISASYVLFVHYHLPLLHSDVVHDTCMLCFVFHVLLYALLAAVVSWYNQIVVLKSFLVHMQLCSGNGSYIIKPIKKPV